MLDEGHAIRNPRAKTTLAVKRLKGAFRLLLSGTPIQNSVAELWSMFDFLMPGFLGTERQFRSRYGGGGRRDTGELDALAVGALHKQAGGPAGWEGGVPTRGVRHGPPAPQLHG